MKEIGGLEKRLNMLSSLCENARTLAQDQSDMAQVSNCWFVYLRMHLNTLKFYSTLYRMSAEKDIRITKTFILILNQQIFLFFPTFSDWLFSAP